MPNPFKRWFKAKSVSIMGATSFSGFEHSNDVNSLNSYADSLYLYIGVSMIAKRAAGIPLELYKIKNKKGDVTEVFDHPLLDLFYNPNPLQTQREFMELSFTYYMLTGDCFWYLERTGPSIASLTALSPNLVEIVLSSDSKTVVAYEYRANTIHRFKPEEIIHIKSVDPSNPLRGIGAVRPATSRIMTETEATKYQANFFQNQGRPDMAVFSSSVVTEAGGADFRLRWKAIFGRGKGGQVAVFGDNVKSVQELNKSPKEMDFIETQKFLRGDILAALHIPEEMVCSDSSNRATSKEAYKMYLQEAVVPVFEAFIDVVNNRLTPQVDIAVFFDFPDPVPVDRSMILEEHKAGVGKWITQNEARQETGRPAIEGHDELGAVSFNSPAPAVTETAKQILRQRPLLVKRLAAIEETVGALLKGEPKRQMNSIFVNRAQKEAYALAYLKSVDKKADKVKAALDEVHSAMEKRILETDLLPNGFMDVGREKKLAKDVLTPIMVKLYTDGGQEALNALFTKSAEHFFADAVLLSAIEGRVDFFTNSIMDTTFEILKSKIVDGVKAGDGIDKIGRSVRDFFTDMSVGRAKTIAQTETNFVLSKSTNDAYSQSNVVTGKEWLSVGDDKVREEHIANEAQGPIGKSEAFSSGEMYPAENSVNCRCVLLPAV